MSGIYLHIPFCKQACHYCDFHFSTNLDKKAELVAAINHELSLQHAYLAGQPVSTIYFGGGTPSLLSSEELASTLRTIRQHYNVQPGAEITLEANPDDLTEGTLATLASVGINRLSIGIQSFDDTVLAYLNRAHDATAARRCIALARQAGFNNISIDLIYAIPGQLQAQWQRNIEEALTLQPEHISSYSLTIEEKTAFGRWAAKGKLAPVTDDTAATQLQLLVDILEQHDYEQYEVSNFARPGYQSRHNSNYWKDEHYLGVGPSAHSYNGSSRQYNIANNHLYLKALAGSTIPTTIEVLTSHDKINDYLLTTLRTSWGANLGHLRGHLGYDLASMHGPYLAQLVDRGLAVIEHGMLRLTKPGKLLADKIASDLFSTGS